MANPNQMTGGLTPPAPPPEQWDFIGELTRPQPIVPAWPVPAVPCGHMLITGFPDTDSVLQTAYDSLWRFLRETLPFPVRVETAMELTDYFESYRIEIRSHDIRIAAGDTEGIRRGIYELIREWRGAATPELPSQTVFRKPWVKNRISRCFFSPINRPPANRDELLDEHNYYPAPYLEKLAAAGINGLWISSEFRQLCSTRFTPKAGKDAEKRLQKLQRTIDQCHRYGIKIFLQMNEPAAWLADDAVLQQTPELGGAEIHGRKCCCPSSEAGRKYLEESCFNIFSAVHGLGGIINIALGEGITTCASDPQVRCPRCSRIPRHEILTGSWEAMLRGIRRADAGGLLISWLYLPAPEKLDPWIFDIVRHAPEGVIVQLNCESGAEVFQQGKTRIAGDYWLSIDEPAENFRKFAEAADGKTAVSAKIQVGCSHEVATIPFVPVPGLLYRKYKTLRELHVNSVMQCWYFGNYPGIMNDAAGLLAFEDFKSSEDEFLYRLALSDWCGNAEIVAAAWRKLGDAYRKYPVCNMLQYFGPVADGISWPLYFEPANRPLNSTWLLNPNIAGDNLCECLLHYSMDDLITQMKLLCEEWSAGSAILSSLRNEYAENPDRLRDIGLAEALEIQFQSALNILKFYRVRLDMQSLALKELQQTKRMLQLVESDSRLGFHSEAEGYKYYPEKLRWRLRELGRTLPAESYRIGYDFWENGPNFRWKAEIGRNHLEIVVESIGIFPDMDELFIGIDDCGFTFPWLMHSAASGRVFSIPENCTCNILSAASGWTMKILIPDSSLSNRTPRRIQLMRMTDLYRTLFSWPALATTPAPRLNLMLYHPANMGLLLNKEGWL